MINTIVSNMTSIGCSYYTLTDSILSNYRCGITRPRFHLSCYENLIKAWMSIGFLFEHLTIEDYRYVRLRWFYSIQTLEIFTFRSVDYLVHLKFKKILIMIRKHILSQDVVQFSMVLMLKKCLLLKLLFCLN